MWDTIHSASSQLVKRSKDFDYIAYMKPDNGDQPPSFKWPNGAPLTILVLVGTIAFISVVLVQYTFKLLLVLTTVEDPPAVYLPINQDTESRNANPEPRQEGDRVFITSSIRGTLRHLRREAGFWSPWRGFAPNLIFSFTYAFIQVLVVSILKAFMPLRLATILGGIASMVFLSKFSMVCTHIMITPPEATYWWTRYCKASWAQANKTVPAILIWATTLQLLSELSNFAAQTDISSGARISIFIINILLYILIGIPATILLTRVQASALPDDAPTIVQFEKTFGQDTSDTGGVLTVQKAIKSIDCATINRVCIYLAKTVPVSIVLPLIVVVLFVLMFIALTPPGQPF